MKVQIGVCMVQITSNCTMNCRFPHESWFMVAKLEKKSASVLKMKTLILLCLQAVAMEQYDELCWEVLVIMCCIMLMYLLLLYQRRRASTD